MTTTAFLPKSAALQQEAARPGGLSNAGDGYRDDFDRDDINNWNNKTFRILPGRTVRDAIEPEFMKT
jgi:hypothetical protein